MMHENRPVSQEESSVDLMEVFAFLRSNRKHFLAVSGGSLVIALLVGAAIFCFCPRTSIYSGNVNILLEKNKDQYLYPSAKPFSSADLLSRPVLKKVYEDCALQKTVSFGDFQKSFFIAQSNSKLASLDAQYREKLNRKNITLVEIAKLERMYREEAERLQSSQLTIAMVAKFPVGRQQAARIVNAIPQAWYEIYSKLEAQRYPQMDAVSQMQELQKLVGKESQLILLEKSRQFCLSLIKMCDFLNNMLQGKNISLPTGEFLGDIRDRLVSLDRYQISVLRQYVLTHPQYQGAFDRIFLDSSLQNIEFELFLQKTKYEGVLNAINVLNAPLQSRAAGTNTASGETPQMTLQLDNNVFSSIAELIRKDQTNVLRREYAEQAMISKDACAELEAEKMRCQQLIKLLGKKTADDASVKPEIFYGQMRNMFNDLFALGNKMTQFRDKIVNEFVSSRQFCAVDKDVRLISEPSFPIFRICVGVFVLWLLLNFTWIFVKFCTRQKAD